MAKRLPKETLAADLLYGADEIAAFIGRPKREIYYLSQTKRLPIGRLGSKLIATRSGLRDAIKELTSGFCESV